MEAPKQPTEKEKYEYALRLGVDLADCPQLAWLAREGVCAELPPNWRACEDELGDGVLSPNASCAGAGLVFGLGLTGGQKVSSPAEYSASLLRSAHGQPQVCALGAEPPLQERRVRDAELRFHREPSPPTAQLQRRVVFVLFAGNQCDSTVPLGVCVHVCVHSTGPAPRDDPADAVWSC